MDWPLIELFSYTLIKLLSTSVVSQAITAGVDPALVRGLGFDATCSLAVVDAAGEPVTVSPSKGVCVCFAMVAD